MTNNRLFLTDRIWNRTNKSMIIATFGIFFFFLDSFFWEISLRFVGSLISLSNKARYTESFLQEYGKFLSRCSVYFEPRTSTRYFEDVDPDKMSRLKRRFFFYSQLLNFRISPSMLNISTYLETLISINITYYFEKDGSANFYINNSKKK